MSAEPYVVAHSNGFGVFQAVGTLFGINGMDGGIEAALRTDEAVASEPDRSAVEDDEIIVGEKVFADFNVESVIAAEARFYEKVFSGVPQNTAQIFRLPSSGSS